jgi:ferric-dicitrate binding protein FerR (iron transport regulator)
MCDASDNPVVCSEDSSEETSHMRHFPLPRFVGGFIVGGMFCMASIVWPQSQDSIGRVTAVEGRATVLRQGRFAPEVVTLQKPVFQEDIIETDVASKVRITLTDATIISLGERSRLELRQFQYDPRQQAHTGRFIIPSGIFRTIIKTLLPQSTIEIITPTALAAIRGTDLMGEVSAESTAIVVLEGTVMVSNVSPRFRALATLTPGTGTTVVDEQPPSAVTKWSESRIEALRQATTIP